VLVDSESITCGVLRDMLEERGWALTLQQCMDIFVGHAVSDKRTEIEAHTGLPLTQEWLLEFRERRNIALVADIQAIPNVLAAVQALHQSMRGRIACASGADRFKVEMMLTQVGLADYFAGNIFSGHEMPRSKPHPDVYLAAAAHLGVNPRVARWWKTPSSACAQACQPVPPCLPMPRSVMVRLCWMLAQVWRSATWLNCPPCFAEVHRTHKKCLSLESSIHHQSRF
jgi:hypothetical protein